MSTIILDPGRVADLEVVFSDAELGEMVAQMMATTEDLLDRLAVALAQHDVHGVTEAAHRGRNEALSVGARELDGAFAALETTAHDARQASAELEAVRALWPATRAAIGRMVSSRAPTRAGRGASPRRPPPPGR